MSICRKVDHLVYLQDSARYGSSRPPPPPPTSSSSRSPNDGRRKWPSRGCEPRCFRSIGHITHACCTVFDWNWSTPTAGGSLISGLSININVDLSQFQSNSVNATCQGQLPTLVTGNVRQLSTFPKHAAGRGGRSINQLLE